MTKEEVHNHLIRFQRFQQNREKYFAPKINEALHHQYMQFVEHYHTEGMSALHRVTSEGIYKIIRNLYIDAGIVYGAKIRADFAKQGFYKGIKEVKNRRPIGFSERMHELLSAYFSSDILKTSQGITDTTKELIKQVFTNAAKLGLGISDIVDQLKGTELSRVRARLIARTETVTASNKGAMFVAIETGLQMNKIWLATIDSRTRADHSAINGRTVGRDDYFNVGGYDMECPGDRGGKDGKPEVPASEICNCRCTVIFRAVRDENGRLVRMQPPANYLVA